MAASCSAGAPVYVIGEGELSHSVLRYTITSCYSAATDETMDRYASQRYDDQLYSPSGRKIQRNEYKQ